MQKAYKKYFWLFVLPVFTAFTLFFLIPFLMGIGLSFFKFTTLSNLEFVGFDNYVRAFSNDDFKDALLFTMKFTLVSVVTVNFFAFFLAYALTRGIKGTNLFRTVFFMPNLIGGIVLGYIWQLLLNGVLANFGMTLLSTAENGFWGMVVMTNWQLIGYMMIIYIAGIQNIPKELTEASSIDGASKFQSLRLITIPMVMSSVTICTFLTLTNAFKLFDQNLALTSGGPGKTTQMLALDIYNTFYNRNGWEGVGQAKAVMFFLLVALISLTQLYFTRKREVES